MKSIKLYNWSLTFYAVSMLIFEFRCAQLHEPEERQCSTGVEYQKSCVYSKVICSYFETSPLWKEKLFGNRDLSNHVQVNEDIDLVDLVLSVGEIGTRKLHRHLVQMHLDYECGPSWYWMQMEFVVSRFFLICMNWREKIHYKWKIWTIEAQKALEIPERMGIDVALFWKVI